MKPLTARRFAPSALLAAALLTVSPAAIAAAPVKDGKPGTLAQDIPAGEGCAFDLRVLGTGSNANIKEFLDESGKIVRTITAGRGYTLTYSRIVNDAPVKSITLRPTGSVQKETIAADRTKTVTATGGNGLILFSTDLPKEAVPSAIQYSGRIVYTVAPDGTFTLISTSGTRLDICAALK
ncbi:hypothetical protein [Pseudarthrobacter sp. MM222]|uniref:hypothetical protein n=1 Tax=Pseudarthrobacter sp. MM222 TaxID=3018929 RepID=UPI002220315A|nr:hypothetical protein [Pseudarthrobacter sp. MM222]CAI3794977.1 hypothetical protein NKCBBBOE_01195 [Pseudarthrobacter sp. MM222]